MVLIVYTLVCVGCVVMCCVRQVKGTSGKDIWTLGEHRVLVKFRKEMYKKYLRIWRPCLNLDFHMFSP